MFGLSEGSTALHNLTQTQREQWAINGYLHLKEVLSTAEINFFSAQMDRIRTEPGWEPAPNGPLGHYAWLEHAVDTHPAGFMDRRDLLTYHHAFIDLIDRPNVFDLIVDIMGPHLLFSMSQAIVRPSSTEFPGYTHTDGGQALRQVRVTETSQPIAMKAMYLLTDVDGNDSGNLTVFPGSHMRPFPERGQRLTPHSPGAAQLAGKAGDCYLFPHALWHGPAPKSVQPAEKNAALQLLPDVRAVLRLRNHPRGSRSLHAPATPIARRSGLRVSSRVVFLCADRSGCRDRRAREVAVRLTRMWVEHLEMVLETRAKIEPRFAIHLRRAGRPHG